MRRIVITRTGEKWSFERQGLESILSDSPLRAAMAAVDYGELLRGKALGYIIRLDHPQATSAEELITLHTCVFSQDTEPWSVAQGNKCPRTL